jgi:hypothetical protein
VPDSNRIIYGFAARLAAPVMRLRTYIDAEILPGGGLVNCSQIFNRPKISLEVKAIQWSKEYGQFSRIGACW